MNKIVEEKASVVYGEEEKEVLLYNKSVFCTSTSNKQLDFIHHIYFILKFDGRTGVVIPNNVLF